MSHDLRVGIFWAACQPLAYFGLSVERGASNDKFSDLGAKRFDVTSLRECSEIVDPFDTSTP